MLHFQNELNRLRCEIDTIDLKILELLRARLDISKQIGLLKNKNDVPVFQSTRKAQALKQRLSWGANLNLPSAFVKKIYETLHDASVEGQEPTHEYKQMNQLPPFSNFEKSDLLIYDETLREKSPEISAWIQGFPLKYAVAAGESLKDIEVFADHLKKINELTGGLLTKSSRFIALGGGSVTDFTGFLASVFKRGAGLVFIPTTWLCAVDSAHGGKTALNVGSIKNQIGSYYPAQEIFLVRSVLNLQPEQRAAEALSELYKIALISGAGWAMEVFKANGLAASELFDKFLIKAIEAKMKIVRLDPTENLGLRHSLNFGHTIGHVIETHFKVSHGLAVALGLRFAISWSLEKGFLSKTDSEILHKYLVPLAKKEDYHLATIPLEAFLKILTQDKKQNFNKTIHFVFIRSIGNVFTETVSINEIAGEAQRQGWVS